MSGKAIPVASIKVGAFLFSLIYLFFPPKIALEDESVGTKKPAIG